MQLTLDWSIKKELVAHDATFSRVLLSYWQGFNLKYPNSIKYYPWNIYILFNNSPAFTVHVMLKELRSQWAGQWYFCAYLRHLVCSVVRFGALQQLCCQVAVFPVKVLEKAGITISNSL